MVKNFFVKLYAKNFFVVSYSVTVQVKKDLHRAKTMFSELYRCSFIIMFFCSDFVLWEAISFANCN